MNIIKYGLQNITNSPGSSENNSQFKLRQLFEFDCLKKYVDVMMS